ncbi:MAG: hypothetical protein KME47_21635 [Nodosilinea sp. WJT8-NPBG4]|nr:hypothetical protein [Nodosilinea sp. WJT8-NPBG4]
MTTEQSPHCKPTMYYGSLAGIDRPIKILRPPQRLERPHPRARQNGRDRITQRRPNMDGHPD